MTRQVKKERVVYKFDGISFVYDSPVSELNETEKQNARISYLESLCAHLSQELNELKKQIKVK